jgi:hypothetical protein
MNDKKFSDLCHDVANSLTDKQAEVLRDHLDNNRGVITLEINAGRTAYDLNAAEELAETIERIGAEASLLILKAWEGGQRG